MANPPAPCGPSVRSSARGRECPTSRARTRGARPGPSDPTPPARDWSTGDPGASRQGVRVGVALWIPMKAKRQLDRQPIRDRTRADPRRSIHQALQRRRAGPRGQHRYGVTIAHPSGAEEVIKSAGASSAAAPLRRYLDDRARDTQAEVHFRPRRGRCRQSEKTSASSHSVRSPETMSRVKRSTAAP